jgi:hypothetical protein
MENNDKRYYDAFFRFGRADTQNIYTGPYLIREILSKISFTSNDKILIWFNVEFALLLVKEFDFNSNHIYIYTNSKEKLIFKNKQFNIIYQEKINLDKIEKEYKNMKFDVVLGNPPFHQKVGPKKTKPLWNKFVKTSFKICKEGGYISLIHPNGWRNIDGNFKDIQQLLKSKNICYLSLHSVEDGQKIFNATTPFDWYVVKNIENNQDTVIKFQDDVIRVVNLKNLEIIPNEMFDIIMDLIGDEGEEKVTVLYSRSAYGTDKKNVSKIQEGNFIYPCVYSILSNGDINWKYSSTNQNGHFGIPKLVLGNGANPTSTIDFNGEFGLTQFAFGIVDDVDNLPLIERAIKSEKFQKINKATKYVATAGNPLVYPKIASLFKKDFWKYFIDE